ncbi:sperm flagellar protein 1 [Aplysia californica]|uniref:Sperm flagellar protein 1 n=1 Tax=Aplysia californica TaxID=6500 RepID=A0ABM1AF70_APLCA|nr:sperm flagellar protein 1 [Aplysia californica]
MAQYVFARRGYNGITRVDMEDYFDDVELESLYQWVDRVPLSRPKKNIGKDFSDGVLVAEIIKHYFPRLVDIHNYTPAAAFKQKMENWYLLNRRVLRRIELDLSDDVIRALSNCKQRVVEKVLMMLRVQIDKFIEKSNRLRLKTLQIQNALGIKDAMDTDLDAMSTASPKPVTGQELVPYNNKAKSPRLSMSLPNVMPHSHPTRSTYASTRSVLTVAPATDNISKVMFEEKELECLAKDETIQILNAKLKRMEQLLHLKEVRIEDLESRLHHVQAIKMAQFTDMPQ